MNDIEYKNLELDLMKCVEDNSEKLYYLDKMAKSVEYPDWDIIHRIYPCLRVMYIDLTTSNINYFYWEAMNREDYQELTDDQFRKCAEEVYSHHDEFVERVESFKKMNEQQKLKHLTSNNKYSAPRRVL